jgi:hypothetical protein|tara:strand:+ start:438 stop:1004 length:567 start_codon:yes stop_codon:yes gene_type:complete
MKSNTKLWLSPATFIESKHFSNEAKAKKIMNLISEFEGLEIDIILKRTRKRNIRLVRQTCQFFVKKYTAISLKGIGRITGGYDHATIIHSCKVIEDECVFDAAFSSRISTIDTMIREMFNIVPPKRFYKTINQTNISHHVLKRINYNINKPLPTKEICKIHNTDAASIFNIKRDAINPKSRLKHILND